MTTGLGAGTLVSAPGKVLLTGGYLVLDRAYKGLVVATDSRFYVSVTPKADGGSVRNEPRITVISPQFTDGKWEYDVSRQPTDEGHVYDIRPVNSQVRNRYVECALLHPLNLASALSGDVESMLLHGLDVVIVGSNDFYSQREQLARRSLPLNHDALATLPPFCSTYSDIANVHKTGLGSSAAMITSLVGALLSHFKVVSLPTGSKGILTNEETFGLKLVHNTAQFCHCLAQGKIGSGFDVSAAVFGNHAYRRFSPIILDPLLKAAGAQNSSLPLKDMREALVPSTSESCWDSEVAQFSLPLGFSLLLADIDAGSSTPKLVSSVLQWRKSKPEEALDLWTQLNAENSAVEKYLRELSRLAAVNPSGYETILADCSKTIASKWQDIPVREELALIHSMFCKLYNAFQAVRKHLRTMSTEADVPIEPAEQTRLLDACMDVPGIVLAGVPGAGGYDAIFCVAISKQARLTVQRTWETWTEMAVGPLLTRESQSGLMQVEAKNVPGLPEALAGAIRID
ncbi:phosphomevalonate kinase [Gaertneriomyces sp. JEL0708]|nr:phosphomevalonate kinase [Gaertneriomyces sp. JEL0708]